MSTDGSREELRAVLAALEVGDWRAVLRPDQALSGSRRLVRLAVAARMTARSMQLQTECDVEGAWYRLAEATPRLPRPYCAADDPTRAALWPAPGDASVENATTWRLARVIWREQCELDDLRRRFQPGLMSPREHLAEACIEHLMWVEDDPFTRAPGRLEAWGPPPDRSRHALCLRGTRLRRFAEPTASDTSRSAWRDLGGFPGVCGEALDRLAARRAAVPWRHKAGAAEVPIRLGRSRAWDRAVTRRADIGYFQ